MSNLKRALEAGCLIALISGCSELLGLDQYGVQGIESECAANESCGSTQQPGQVVGLEAIGKVVEPTIDVDEAADAGPHKDGELQPAAPNAGGAAPDGGTGGASSRAGSNGGGTSTDGGRTMVTAQCSPTGVGNCSGNVGVIGGCQSSADCVAASTEPVCNAASGVCLGCTTDDDCTGNTAGASCVTSGPQKGACAACDPGDNSGCVWPNGRCDPEALNCGTPPSCAGLDAMCRSVSYMGTGGYTGAVMNGTGAYGPTGPVGTPITVGEDCCSSPIVSGGAFVRSNDASHPANVKSFRLDRFEVVVGRFQRFVKAWVDGFRPSAGDGKHAHTHGGSGLAKTGGEFEEGWDVKWADNLPATAEAWDAGLSCEPNYRTWPSSTMRPQTCATWYEAYAFCIWDGGFLPSEAEMNYAAAGGAAQRQYPWGNAVPSTDAALAAYGCYYNGAGTCSGVMNIASAGSIPAGDGMFGQADLAGNVWEWTLDLYSPSYSSASCDDCVDSSPSQHRVRRGGSFRYSGESLASSFRSREAPMNRRVDGGFRCARAP